MPSTIPVGRSVAVIGDVRGSRRAVDRQVLHDKLTGVLVAVNDAVTSLDPLRITVGDEFQGRYASLGAAVDAVYAVHLALRPTVSVRFGIGRGTATTLDARSGIHDGSAFWNARAAIDTAKSGESGPLRLRRAVFVDPDGSADLTAAVNAALTTLDELVFGMDERDSRLLAGLIDGRTQRELAHAEGISASAVSQRLRRSGAAAARAAIAGLAGLS